jgi:HEAT repeat protein
MASGGSSEMAPLRECEANPARPEAESRIRAGLASANNRVVELAAKLAGEQGRKSLVDALRVAYNRFLTAGGNADRGCLAKTEIVDALRLLDYDDAQFFLAGVRFHQYDPCFGGSTDSAARLRALCGFALIQQSHPQAMSELVDLLADPEKTARAGAARAIAHGGGRESEWLLRLKISLGDKDPEVMGECFSGLLRLDPRQGIARVAPFLSDPSEELACEAAIALGETRLPAALPYLQTQLLRAKSRDYIRTLLMAIGLLGTSEAIDHLISVVEEGDYDVAVAAIEALGNCRDRAAIKERLEAVVNKPANARLRNALVSAFRG